jgi:hypothetical protein
MTKVSSTASWIGMDESGRLYHSKQRRDKCFGIVKGRKRGRKDCLDPKEYPARWGDTWWFN